MNIEEENIKEENLREYLLPKLINKIFHVTMPESLDNIITDGFIKSNLNNKYDYAYSQSKNSYFRKRNCVSIFDLREKTEEIINDTLQKYYFLNPFNYSHIYLFFKNDIAKDLISPNYSDCYSDMIIPYVEYGIKECININLVESILKISVIRDETSIDWFIEKAYNDRSTHILPLSSCHIGRLIEKSRNEDIKNSKHE